MQSQLLVGMKGSHQQHQEGGLRALKADPNEANHEYCYDITVSSGKICCTKKYVKGSGFPEGTVCFMSENPFCSDINNAKFESGPETDKTDSSVDGEEVFPNALDPNEFKLNDDVYAKAGSGAKDYDYHLGKKTQHGVETEGKHAKEDGNKVLTVDAASSKELSFSTNFDVTAAVMKAGNGALIYPGTTRSMDDLETPLNNGGSQAALSHFQVCFNNEDGDTPTAPTPDTPTAPTPDTPTAPTPDTPTAPSPTPDSICLPTLDFEKDGNGKATSAGDLAADMWKELGITISTTNSAKPAMLFDTANPTGGDEDLAHDTEGMVLIVSEDGDQDDPDDNAGLERVIFEFDEPVKFYSIGLIDTEEQGYLFVYDADGKKIEDGTKLPTMGDGETERLKVDATNVKKIEVEFHGSGAITDIEFCSKDTPKSPTPATPTPPSPTPGTSGDPHIKKWDGTQYDFHGACDLVMLHNPGKC